MTQTVPATAVLGPGKTGLTIGLRVLNLDGTEYAAFATTDVAETSVAGTYRKAGGVVVPDAGGYIVWGVSGTDYAEATVESTAANVTHHAGVAVAAADAYGNVPVVLYGTQPAVTFGQVKITANVSGQGALDVRNSNAYGHGLYADGGNFGLRTQGSNGGQGNFGTYYGQVNSGATGAYNSGSTADVEGVDEAGIRAALGMAAADLDTQLAAIGIDGQDVADALLLAPSGVAAAGSAMDYLADIVEDTGTTLPATLANVGATVTVVSAVSGGNVAVYANDTWRFAVTDATLTLSGYEALALVVKRTARQDDSDALLYLRSDTGLARIDGAAPISAANGTLTKSSTSFTAVVAIAETVGIANGKYTWWLKGFDTTPDPDEGLTLAVGTFTVADPGLQAIA